jgi:hypothetical protein
MLALKLLRHKLAWPPALPAPLGHALVAYLPLKVRYKGLPLAAR